MNTHTAIAIIIALFAACGAWGVYGALSYMTYDTLTKIHILEEESYTLSRHNDAAKKVEHAFEQTREIRDVLRSRIVEGDDGILQLIDIIEDMGESAGVVLTLHDIDTRQKSTDGTEISSLDISVTTVGTWEQSVLYVALLETYPWNITVGEIDFQYNGEEDVWRGSHTFRLLNVTL